MEKLLIVENCAELSGQLKGGLDRCYAVLLADNRTKALSLFEKHLPKVVVLDLCLPPDENASDEGFRCLDEVLMTFPLAKVIVLARNGAREDALRAIQMGAYDFYDKPLALGELKVIINRAFHLYALDEDTRKLHGILGHENTFPGGMIGRCPAMSEVFSLIRKVAPSDVSVFIKGESGTGKELVAKAIHSLDLRKGGIFVPINCAAIPEGLFESELFGYERGSFTGAYTQMQGKIEYAHRGTLFLDEIGEFPGHLQVKLLRFLQDKTLQRIGGREDIAVDARIIAATNKDIGRSIEERRFREDLYYRISVITINLPPLRERGDDIMLLSNFFLARYSSEFRKKLRGFRTSSLELLKWYTWPGNVRELENRIQRAVIMSESSMIEPHDLGFAKEKAARKSLCKEGATLREVKDKVEREMILSFLDRLGGNITKAALELDISRPTLYDLMKKHGIYHSTLSSQR